MRVPPAGFLLCQASVLDRCQDANCLKKIGFIIGPADDSNDYIFQSANKSIFIIFPVTHFCETKDVEKMTV